MKNLNQPIVSVIVAVLDAAKTLERCIHSFAKQTYLNKELIIIDGGSKDGSIELLKANQNIISHWISESDNGVYSAWNKGLSHANGEWICFVGADDYFWDEYVLERMAAELIIVHEDIRVVYGKIMLLNAKGDPLYLIGEPWIDVKERFKQLMSIPHPCLMHRRSLFQQHGVFDESFRIGGDYELLLRELKFADAIFIPNMISIGMRQGGLSSTPSNALRSIMEARRAQKMHGFLIPGMFWILAIVRIYLRMLLWRTIGERRANIFLDLARKTYGLPAFWSKL